MRLIFDRGTLLLEGAGRDLGLDGVGGLCWDGRVGAYRAPAAEHRRLVTELRQRGARFSDDVVSEMENRERQPALAGAPPVTGLRPYQEEALEAWELAGRRGTVVLPTGSGKTRVAMAAIARAARPTLCLVPTRVLLHQFCEELGRWFGNTVGPMGGVGRIGDGERDVRPLTVCTFESAYRHMAWFGRRFELLVVDEAHHFGQGLRDEALQMCIAAWRLGLTATPPSDPGHGARLAELLGDVVYELGVADLAGSYLASFDVVTLHLDLDPRERAAYEHEMATFRRVFGAFLDRHPGAAWRDFVAAASRSADGDRAMLALRRAQRLCAFTRAKRETLARLLARHRTARTLVFTADTATAYAVARQELIMPLTSEIGRAERERALAAFREGRLRALVACRVLNEGLDVPDAEVAIVLGGALGEREHVQRVGRLLRPRPAKRALVYELVSKGTLEVRKAEKRRRALGQRRDAQL